VPVSPNYQAAPLLPTLPNEDGAPFFDHVKAAGFPKTIVRFRNRDWDKKVGLGDLSHAEWIDHFGKFTPLPENLTTPLAIRYHGHQFRHYNPDIGDGRGFLFAQLRDAQGRLLDLGTKGSGQTPYSRSGDGRLTLKGGVREILATQMLEALGVYTSKSFSLIETGENLVRNDEPSPARSAVLTRLSHSHIRFGVFQRLAFEENASALEALIDYCCTHFFPSLKNLPSDERVLKFYEAVMHHCAHMTASWMAAGFVHGVLNTDNMNITGESFDYGPWRFISDVDPTFTAAYFDHSSLYAYGRQGEAVTWNIAQLGGALVQISDADKLSDTLQRFPKFFEEAMIGAFLNRLGMAKSSEPANDQKFVMEWLKFLNETRLPFEQVMYDWFGAAAAESRAKASKLKDHYDGEIFKAARDHLIKSTPIAPERQDHPYFQTGLPCTMLIEEVEAIWDEIATHDNWQDFEKKLNDINMMGEGYGFEASLFVPEHE